MRIRLLSPHPALLLEASQRILMASDLHIGLEHELSKMGINLPNQAERILGELLSLVEEHKPNRVVLLGDIKHAVPITSFQERREIPRFFSQLLEEVEAVDVVRGNHDANLQQLLPEGVAIHPSRGLLLDEDGYKVAVIHGHAWPYPKLLTADLLLMGHNHPTVLLRTPSGVRLSQRVWVKGPCDGSKLAEAYLNQMGVKAVGDPRRVFKERLGFEVGDPEMILFPAFNDLLGGLPINAESPKSLLGPLLRTGAIDIEDFEVYLLDGTYLGKVSFLRGLA
ncbi:metallophosphoesterase [Candidatus Bathyarchaeota archaeon]|nr:MAG: metallophosphoesterase [Candidatus Bathyarchaeota archaeon]